MKVSKQVARRFLLGRAGLWPGRRWRGVRGTEVAMQAMGNVQLDPLQVTARAQDLALQSRVIDYRQDEWARLTYEKRRFFEWGGWLALRPMEELPYYRVLMRRQPHEASMRRYLEWGAPAVEEMRTVLRDRGELSNRDFAMGDRTRVRSYRGRKDSAVALHYLWRVGEAMVVRRERFERVYAPAEVVAPSELLAPVSDEEADDFLLLKGVASAGFSRLNGASATLLRPVTSREVRAWRERMVAEGALIDVEVEGLGGRHLALGSDGPALEALAAGRVPRAWKPFETTTTDEATFLSPLDPAIHDRERTRRLFGFDYKWGVYDKLEKRKFGYYDLPILWRDRIVGRFDPKLDRSTGTLVINGLWLEDEALATDDDFADALGRGMARFLEFLEAGAIDVRAVPQPALRKRLAAQTRRAA